MEMLESIFNTGADTTTAHLTLTNLLAVVGSALLSGLIIAGGYLLCRRRYGQGSSSYVITLVVMPMIVGTIIFFVGNQIARAFSVAGIFSIVRFRSLPTNLRDIAYIFFTVCTGLICGLGYITFGVLVAILLSAIMFLISLVRVKDLRNVYDLKIAVPETLNFKNVFDDVISKYVHTKKLIRIKTTDYGALYVLTYSIVLRDGADERSMLDELRARNGNMDVTLTLRCPEQEDYYD